MDISKIEAKRPHLQQRLSYFLKNLTKNDLDALKCVLMIMHEYNLDEHELYTMIGELEQNATNTAVRLRETLG